MMPGPGSVGSRGGAKGGMRPRRDGGFSPALGSPDQHQDEAAMKAAVKQKQLQQQSSSTQSSSGKSGKTPLASSAQEDITQGDQSRAVSDLKTELVTRPLKDIKQSLTSLGDLNRLLKIENEDTPEEKARKQKMHQRYQQLNQEQQAVAKKKYQELLQRKKKEQEAEEERKEAEQAQKEEQAIAPPSGPQKGPIGPAVGMSRKKKAETTLQQQRQGLGPVGRQH